MSVFEYPYSARNVSSGDITTAGEDPSGGSSRTVHTSLLDSTVQTSMIPSRELVARMVPNWETAIPVMKWPLRGDSTTFKSHKRIVLSQDADARRDPTGENWTAATERACPSK